MLARSIEGPEDTRSAYAAPDRRNIDTGPGADPPRLAEDFEGPTEESICERTQGISIRLAFTLGPDSAEAMNILGNMTDDPEPRPAFLGSPLRLGVTRGNAPIVNPWYPLGSQAPRPALKAAHFCETASTPIPLAIHCRRATTSRAHRAPPGAQGTAASTAERRHLINATLGSEHTDKRPHRRGEATWWSTLQGLGASRPGRSASG
jgi:hypothetical protein